MATFYRGDIVGDELGLKYRVLDFTDDGMVDLLILDGHEDTDDNIVEAKVDVLHLVSRPILVTVRKYFKRIITGDK